MAEYVAKKQPAKLVAINELKENFSQYKDFIFTDYRGLTVEQITNLRIALRKFKAQYKVVKNNFAEIAFQDMNCPDVSKYLVGPTAIALAGEDSNQVVKQLLDFTKDTSIKIKGGLVDRTIFDQKQIEAFSKLPSRSELYSKMMGSMNAPAQNMVYVLNGVTTKLVRALQAVADKKSA
jgi:large subunit ribosomal protein L10